MNKINHILNNNNKIIEFNTEKERKREKYV